MSAAQPCQNCGHQNSPDAMFCSKCGTKSAPSGEAVLSAPPLSEPAPPPSEPAPPPSAPPPSEPPPSEPPPSAPPPSEPPGSTDPSKKRNRIAGQAKTMLGVGQLDREVIEEAKRHAAENRAKKASDRAVPQTAPPKVAVAGQGRTMLGMAAPQKAQVEAAIQTARAKADEKAARKARESNRPSARPEAAIEPMTNRTMLGQPAPKSDPPPKKPKGLDPQLTPPRQRAPVIYPTDTGEEMALSLPTRKPARGLAIAALVVGLVVLAIGGGALAWSIFASGSDLNASVVQSEGGEMLEIEVPGAEAGASVRFGGEERELDAGRARFPLSADDLVIGDNELSVDVIDADGSVETYAVELHLDLRVRADLGPLSNVPPAIEVVVEAPPGSEVTLDGDALELDGQGRGTRRFEIDGAEASAEGVVEHVVRYRVHPPEGDSAQGELQTRIPLTTLQLDRPGEELVTDREAVDFAGAVAPGSTVTIGGENVSVNRGRFLRTHPLPSIGEHVVEVIARAPGRAPHVSRVRIRRVADLAVEAESFEYNAELTYARIAENPATYRGQTVRFEGIVYNLDVSDGRSVLQILVSECPAGDRCPLWVTYSAATEAELRSRVRVLGTIAGQQQFRSQSGQVRTVPRVDATFVLLVRANQRR